MDAWHKDAMYKGCQIQASAKQCMCMLGHAYSTDHNCGVHMFAYMHYVAIK